MAFLRRRNLACPFFVPREILNDGSWPHPSRLPLGAGWRGTCSSAGHDLTPDDATLREFCNLGNAHACPHISADRDWDAIRFSVARANVEQVTLWYVCEAGYAPREHGKLTYDRVREFWVNPHPDPRVQRLASCYMESYQSRQNTA